MLYPNACEGFGGNLSLHALSESPPPESPAFASDLDREVAFLLKAMSYFPCQSEKIQRETRLMDPTHNDYILWRVISQG